MGHAHLPLYRPLSPYVSVAPIAGATPESILKPCPQWYERTWIELLLDSDPTGSRTHNCLIESPTPCYTTRGRRLSTNYGRVLPGHAVGAYKFGMDKRRIQGKKRRVEYVSGY